MRRAFQNLLVAADDPSYLEKQVYPDEDLIAIGSLDMKKLREEYIRRQTNFDITPFDPEGRAFRIFPSGVTIWSGFPGAGKTTLLRQFICQQLAKGQGVFVASLEEKPLDVFYRLACTAIGSSDPSEEALEWCAYHWDGKLRIWSGVDIAASHRLLAAIRILAKDGMRHAVIDSLMCLDLRNDDWDGQRMFANAMRRTVNACGAHIHLVAHPRKLVSAHQDIDINDVAGAREIGGLADNVVFVRRSKDESIVTDSRCTPMCISIRKQRNWSGAIGDITGWFNRDLKQFKLDQFDCLPSRYVDMRGSAVA